MVFGVLLHRFKGSACGLLVVSLFVRVGVLVGVHGVMTVRCVQWQWHTTITSSFAREKIWFEGIADIQRYVQSDKQSRH